MLQLMFNPGLTLTSFRTTWPWRWSITTLSHQPIAHVEEVFPCSIFHSVIWQKVWSSLISQRNNLQALSLQNYPWRTFLILWKNQHFVDEIKIRLDHMLSIKMYILVILIDQSKKRDCHVYTNMQFLEIGN